ncbi:MAG: hypothetical protein LH475_03235 [Cryobacterium sp.]|uniref:hypothetical protein n=1 Tax=unclassified Cryobacterium TaxID=2649013 RepID=UPI0018C91347|nr:MULTISPECIES: hypothetical protein [unclassified Cryobacterium]MCY7403638.1 hypothetical protein [Cryobacterium sp.]MEC5155623.1 hypothetical protein [Cryobacterium sp. CAN_C3]
MKVDGHGVEVTCEVLRAQGVLVTSWVFVPRRPALSPKRTLFDAVSVDRLMRLEGMNGLVRGRKPRGTVAHEGLVVSIGTIGDANGKPG